MWNMETRKPKEQLPECVRKTPSMQSFPQITFFIFLSVIHEPGLDAMPPPTFGGGYGIGIVRMAHHCRARLPPVAR